MGMSSSRSKTSGEADFTKRISVQVIKHPLAVSKLLTFWEAEVVPAGSIKGGLIWPFPPPYTIYIYVDRATTVRVYLQPWEGKGFLFMEERAFAAADTLVWTINHQAHAIAIAVVDEAKVSIWVRCWAQFEKPSS